MFVLKRPLVAHLTLGRERAEAKISLDEKQCVTIERGTLEQPKSKKLPSKGPSAE